MTAARDDDTGRPVILKVDRLCKNFGGLQAVTEFDLSLGAGDLKGLIGPNGAGKSTVFNLISGLHKPTSGKVTLEGEDITGRSPDRIVKRGVARTFQMVRILENRSVLDTMMTSFFLAYRYNVLDAVFLTRRYFEEEKRLAERAVYYLSLLGVDHLKDKNGNELPYGLQRKVDIARTLCLGPKVLLLDEPMAGLNHQEKNELVDTILRLREEFNLSIILIEHDMRIIMNMCESIMAMNQGTRISEGTADEIRQDPEVIAAYLGVTDA